MITTFASCATLGCRVCCQNLERSKNKLEVLWYELGDVERRRERRRERGRERGREREGERKMEGGR